MNYYMGGLGVGLIGIGLSVLTCVQMRDAFLALVTLPLLTYTSLDMWLTGAKWTIVITRDNSKTKISKTNISFHNQN